MLSLSSSAALSFSPASAVRSPVQQRTTAPIMETKADLEALAKELNPIVGFWVRTPPPGCHSREHPSPPCEFLTAP